MNSMGNYDSILFSSTKKDEAQWLSCWPKVGSKMNTMKRMSTQPTSLCVISRKQHIQSLNHSYFSLLQTIYGTNLAVYLKVSKWCAVSKFQDLHKKETKTNAST